MSIRPIYAGLTFFTSTGQRDRDRINSSYAVNCPRFQLPPFQIRRSHIADQAVQYIRLKNEDGTTAQDITDYFNNGNDVVTGNYIANTYNTFTSSTDEITSALKTEACGVDMTRIRTSGAAYYVTSGER